MVFIELQSLCCDFVQGGGGHVNSALDLRGSHEFCVGLAPIFRPPQHFSNEHSLTICESNAQYTPLALNISSLSN